MQRILKCKYYTFNPSHNSIWQVVAVKLGHVLVVDEADKAPTNVTCVLKTLVESGEMHLADGRRIVAGPYLH